MENILSKYSKTTKILAVAGLAVGAFYAYKTKKSIAMTAGIALASGLGAMLIGSFVFPVKAAPSVAAPIAVSNIKEESDTPNADPFDIEDPFTKQL